MTTTNWITKDLGPRQAKRVEQAIREFWWEAGTYVEITDHGRFGMRPLVGPSRGDAAGRLEAIRSKYANTVTGANHRAIEAEIRAEIAAMRATRPEIDVRSTPEERARQEAEDADRRAAEARQAEARAAEEAAWKELVLRGPAETGAVIVAELEKNESDIMTDYFSSRTVRRVVIGYRTGMREDFRQLRAAAATFPETAHLGPGCSHVEVYARWTRADQTSGARAGDPAPYGLALDRSRFATRRAAEDAIAASIEELPEGIEYVIHETSVEHRDNHAGGHGNWLGVDRYAGWQVRSVTRFPGDYEEAIAAPVAAEASVGVAGGVMLSPGQKPGYVEIRFPSKPSKEVRSVLKGSGFRWAKSSGCWYGPEQRLPECYRTSAEPAGNVGPASGDGSGDPSSACA